MAGLLRHQGAPEEGTATEGGPQTGNDQHLCHDTDCAHAAQLKPRVRHRPHKAPQHKRPHQKSTRLDDDELALISAAAAACGMTPAGFLAHAALAAARDLNTTAAAVAGERELVTELFAARRHLAQVGNNLNQIAKLLNSGAEAPHAATVLTAVMNAVTRLDAATDRLLDHRDAAG
ncbi:plasmid mobilization protein [Embleya sp. NPDC059237]|uniref:plasmid mobilization protein n=1 Tax=unclassified Embleya TaxID=2699296 RepID=UPI00368DEB9A